MISCLNCNHNCLFPKRKRKSWLVWLSGLRASLQTKGSPVQFPVRAQAWVAGQVPGGRLVRGNHTLMFLSLSFSLPSPLTKNKLIKSLFKKERKRGKCGERQGERKRERSRDFQSCNFLQLFQHNTNSLVRFQLINLYWLYNYKTFCISYLLLKNYTKTTIFYYPYFLYDLAECLKVSQEVQ